MVREPTDLWTICDQTAAAETRKTLKESVWKNSRHHETVSGVTSKFKSFPFFCTRWCYFVHPCWGFIWSSCGWHEGFLSVPAAAELLFIHRWWWGDVVMWWAGESTSFPAVSARAAAEETACRPTLKTFLCFLFFFSCARWRVNRRTVNVLWEMTESLRLDWSHLQPLSPTWTGRLKEYV